MYILKHYFKPENKTDNSDFTIFGMKIGPVPDLQELPSSRRLMYLHHIIQKEENELIKH